MRPNTTLSNYSSIDPQTCKNHLRDRSESFVVSSSRNDWKLSKHSQRRASKQKQESLLSSFSNTSMCAMDILRNKQNRFNSVRRSWDQNILRSFQNDSIADLNELRNKNKLNRQMKDFNEQLGMSFDESQEFCKSKENHLKFRGLRITFVFGCNA